MEVDEMKVTGVDPIQILMEDRFFEAVRERIAKIVQLNSS